jgi:hypothetical protein
MTDIKSIPAIFPESFFNIPHPDNPWISIQFRTSVADPITDGSQWEEITLNPSNFFDNVTIEDESGFQRVELNLVDQYFTRLETLITKSLISVREAQNFSKSQITKSSSEQWFEFKIDNSTMINLRLRFGYGNINNDDTTFIDSTDYNGDFNDRINGKTCIRTPWIYLQILNVFFKLTEFGLSATISAISTTETWLSRAKMLRRFFIFKETPENILRWVKKTVEKISKSQITVEVEENTPEKIKLTDPVDPGYIEIMLGNEIDENNRTNYRTMKSFLDELCAKIPARIINDKNQPANENEIENTNEKLNMAFKYSYMLQQNKDATHNKLKFYYPDPTTKNQPKMRTYVWREYGQSIVKSLEIDSRTDFSALNYQLFTIDTSKKNVSLTLHATNTTSTTEDIKTARLISPVETTDALKNFEIAYVSDITNISGPQKDLAGLITQQVVYWLNQGVFSGTMTIPGDPFYLFDNNVRPFEYMIRVIILRPGFIDEEGDFTGSKELQQSYLSGYYVIKKITHRIDSNGYNTILDIGRWPTN